MMNIAKKSPLTGFMNERALDITPEQLAAWEGGELIQKAMPNISADDREFLITGYTPEDWKTIFGG